MTIEVWSWRRAVQKSGLKSTTKHVLLNLAVYMNDAGEGCYPSVREQADDASLSPKTVCEHIEFAVTAGFLEKAVVGYSGQGWAKNGYKATVPAGFVFPAKKKVKGVYGGFTRFNQKVLTVPPEGVNSHGGKVLTDGASNSSENSTKNSPIRAHDAPVENSAYRIENSLTEEGRDRARRAAPGWDLYHLMRIFDANVNVGGWDRPQKPDSAFAKFCQKYTKGKRA